MNEKKTNIGISKSSDKNSIQIRHPETKGYQPKVSNLNPSKPPQGGSGVSQNKKSR